MVDRVHRFGPKSISKWREAIRDGLWFTPLAFLVAGAALGVGLPLLERWTEVGTVSALLGLSHVSAGGARELLAVAASALATIIAIASSVTIVTVQLAAGQYTPRLLRRFMADRPMRRMLGAFIGTIVYLLVMLPSLHSSEESVTPFVPVLSLALGVLATIGCLGVLVLLLHHATRAIQAATIVAGIGREIIELVESSDRGGDRSATAEELAEAEVGERVVADAIGYVQGIDRESIARIAGASRATLARLEVRPGDFVFDGLPLVTLAPPAAIPDETRQAIRAAFVLGRERTMRQDPLFGVRQLTDVALKALSPGINDVTTAVMVLNELGGVVRVVSRTGHLGRDHRVSSVGEVRIVERSFGVATILEEGFDELPLAGRDQPRFLARGLEVLAQLAALAPTDAVRDELVACGERFRGALSADARADAGLVADRWHALRRAGEGSGARPVPRSHVR